MGIIASDAPYCRCRNGLSVRAILRRVRGASGSEARTLAWWLAERRQIVSVSPLFGRGP